MANPHGPIWRRIPAPIWALGFTSMFMDMSSEAIHALLPIFLVQTLGASASVLGVLEGFAEGLTSIMKLFSGVLSDRLNARKGLTIVGYSLAALSKPLFALATTVPMVAFARLSDRFGKGIRGAPRDALVADLTPKEIRGAAYGLRQALDTVGAVVGPMTAILLMSIGFDIRAVFWATVVPAALAVLVLWLGVKEPRAKQEASAKRLHWRDTIQMPTAFWAVVAVGGALTMARFSEAFLILRAQDQGLALHLVPLVLVVMSVVYALVSYPAGVLADKVPPIWLLAAGCAVLIGADTLLAFHHGVLVAMTGIGLWGLHMGLTQGVLAAMVAAVAPDRVRASAFGIFNLAVGVITVLSSSVAGVLWQYQGPSATFISGGIFSALSLFGALSLASVFHRHNVPKSL